MCEVNTKFCTKCGTERQLEDFANCKGKKRRDGSRCEYKRAECKYCRNEILSIWRQNNPMYSKINSALWRSDNTERVKNYTLNYRNENKEIVKYRKKQWDLKSDKYVEYLLCLSGFPKSSINKDVIEVKRLILKTNRELKKINK